MRLPSSPYQRKRSIATCISIFASASGLPISRVRLALLTSNRSSRRRAAFSRMACRLSGVMARQWLNPSRLLSRARSRSAGLACGTCPISLPSAGQITGSLLPVLPKTHSPAISIFNSGYDIGSSPFRISITPLTWMAIRHASITKIAAMTIFGK